MGPYLNDIGHNANNANNGNQNFPLLFKYGYFGHSKTFRCYLRMRILTISNLRCLTHFFRCHLRMGQKVLLLFKYEFFETLILSQSQKKVIILQLFLEFEFAAQFVFETQIHIYSATQILNEINFGESKL